MPLAITTRTSPNKVLGRTTFKPEAIVLHTCEGDFAGCVGWVCNSSSMVSYHYVISETGEICQTVNPTDTAWHAGRINAPTWKLIKPNINPNLYTIGISCGGFAKDNHSPAQLHSLAQLVAKLCVDYKIPCDADHIVYHKEIAVDKGDFGDISLKPVIVGIIKLYYNYLCQAEQHTA